MRMSKGMGMGMSMGKSKMGKEERMGEGVGQRQSKGVAASR
jgi:hypothetical protein